MAMKSVSDSKSTDGNHHKMDLVSFKKDLDKQQDEGEGWRMCTSGRTSAFSTSVQFVLVYSC